MKGHIKTLALLFCFFCLLSCVDHQQTSIVDKSIELNNWRLSHPIPGQSISVGYGIIINNSNMPITLVSVESDLADSIEIHRHEHHDGIMRMIELESLTIAPKSEISFTTSSYHLMVFEPKLKALDSVTLTFEFSNQKVMTVDANLFYR